jgi:hypothetical protein
MIIELTVHLSLATILPSSVVAEACASRKLSNSWPIGLAWIISDRVDIDQEDQHFSYCGLEAAL